MQGKVDACPARVRRAQRLYTACKIYLTNCDHGVRAPFIKCKLTCNMCVEVLQHLTMRRSPGSAARTADLDPAAAAAARTMVSLLMWGAVRCTLPTVARCRADKADAVPCSGRHSQFVFYKAELHGRSIVAEPEKMEGTKGSIFTYLDLRREPATRAAAGAPAGRRL